MDTNYTRSHAAILAWWRELRDDQTLRLGPVLITTTKAMARDIGEARASAEIHGRSDERRRLLKY